jgi:hypothetical protein
MVVRKEANGTGTVDRIAEVVGFVNHIWLTALTDPALKKETCLKYVNHMWSGGHPYWNLWYADHMGVYRLELQRAGALPPFDWVAEFAIKYYPRETEAYFNGLSSLEKLCRTSEVFHDVPSGTGEACCCTFDDLSHRRETFDDLALGTGVPACQFDDAIPPTFFYAGTLLFSFAPKSGCLLHLLTQTSWIVAASERYEVSGDSDSGSVYVALDKGAVDRHYPGFAITSYLFQRFASTIAGVGKYDCKTESTRKVDGLRYVTHGKRLTAERCSDLRSIIITLELTRMPHVKLPHLPRSVFRKPHFESGLQESGTTAERVLRLD